MPLMVWFLVADYYMNQYAKSVDLEKVNRKFKSFQAKVPTLGPDFGKTVYIVTGGAGFVGAWIARFLLLRNDTDIIILDNNPSPPGDLVKHGVKAVQCELLDKEEIETAIENLKIDKNVTIVVFHAATIQRYFLSWLSFHSRVSAKNVEMVQNLIDVFTDFSRSKSIPVVFINISDAISHRSPVSWWKVWNYKSWAQAAVAKPSNGFISSFAQSKAESEALVLEANDGKNLITASLDPLGIVCGYYGDPLFSPCLYYNGALNHYWDVPISFLHVEDLARAALLLEAKLRIKTATANVQGKSFLISNGQMTRMDEAFALIKKAMGLKIIRLNPAFVLLVSYGAQLLSMITPSGRSGWQKRDDSLFSGRWWSLTPSRFNTLQLCQIPDKERMQETKDLLGFEAARTCEDSILTTVDDYIRINQHMTEMKKARKEAEEKREEELKKKEIERRFGKQVK